MTMIHRLRTAGIRNRTFYIFESHWDDPEDFVGLPHAGQYEQLCGKPRVLTPKPGIFKRIFRQ